MPSSMTAEVQQLMQEGRAAALAGDTMVARDRFRRATELDAGNAEAWLELSGVLPVLSEKRESLRRALEIAPENGEAQASLAYVEKLLAEGLRLAPAQRRVAPPELVEAAAVETLSEPEVAATPQTLFCYRHPNRETGLRCIQCNRPICSQCAHGTPVGFLCPDDRKARRPRNYQVEPGHIIAGAILALVIGAVTSVIVPFIAGIVPFFGFFLGLLAGPLVAELTIRVSDRVTRLKRGREMQIAVGSGIALGTLPMLILFILNPSIFTLILLLYMILAISTAVARLR